MRLDIKECIDELQGRVPWLSGILLEIFNDDFKDKYDVRNIILPLRSYQLLFNKINDRKIEHIDTFNTEEPKEILIDIILNKLPKTIGNSSAFVINIGDHWVGMVLYRSKDMIHVRYSDSNGAEMPSILRDILSSELITDAFCTTPDHLDIRDYKCKVDGGDNSCGSKTIEQIAKIIERPDSETLDSQPIRDAFHTKLIRFFDVLFASDFVENIQTDRQKEILLNMFHVRCNIKSMEVVDGKGVFKEFNEEKLIEVLDGTVKALYAYLSKDFFEDTLAATLLGPCIDKVPHIDDYRGGIIADQICRSLLRQFEEAPQHPAAPSTSAQHQEAAGGGGVEESKESEQKFIKDFYLKGLGRVVLYDDGSAKLWTEDSQITKGTFEEKDDITIVAFPDGLQLCRDGEEVTILGDVT